MQEQYYLVHVPVEGGRVEQVEALVVGEERIGTMIEEQVDNVVVAALRSPENWCCDGVAAFCVDGGAGLDEEMAEGVVVVDCCPLFRRLASLYPMKIMDMYVRTCSGVMPCSSLYVASNFPLSNSFWIAAISPSRANCMISSSTGRLGFLSAMSDSSCSPTGSPLASGCAAEDISGVRVSVEPRGQAA